MERWEWCKDCGAPTSRKTVSGTYVCWACFQVLRVRTTLRMLEVKQAERRMERGWEPPGEAAPEDDGDYMPYRAATEGGTA